MFSAIVLFVVSFMFPINDRNFYIGDTLDREYEEERQRDTRPIPPTAKHEHDE